MSPRSWIACTSASWAARVSGSPVSMYSMVALSPNLRRISSPINAVISSGDQDGPQPPLEQFVSTARSNTWTFTMLLTFCLCYRDGAGRTDTYTRSTPGATLRVDRPRARPAAGLEAVDGSLRADPPGQTGGRTVAPA